MNIQVDASCEICDLPESLKTRGNSLVRRSTKGSPDLEVRTWSHPAAKATLYPDRLKPLHCQWQSSSHCKICSPRPTPFFFRIFHSILCPRAAYLIINLIFFFLILFLVKQSRIQSGDSVAL